MTLNANRFPFDECPVLSVDRSRFDGNAVAKQMRAMLYGAAFNDEVFDQVRGTQLIVEAEAPLDAVATCAANAVQCTE
jgi:hypothetical protein